ncbi:MAG: BatA domain-containing protein [Bernardetiaceae bacterium]|nr:BatA domain-containing protein [Bernardetiaceae bacterium]
MIFLNPAYLWFLSLVLIPVIIHFFNFQRPKKVLFSNVSFLKEVNQASNARNKLRDLLIMFMRMCFIAALVLAFAEPVEKGAQTQVWESENFVSIYADNSFSMQNETDNVRLLDRAAKAGEQLADVFPKNTRFQLIENSFSTNPNTFYDKDGLKDKFSLFSFANNARTIEQVYKKQLLALNNNATQNSGHIFWISDFQKSTTGDLSNLEIDTAKSIYVVALEPSQTQNLYVDSVWFEDPFVKLNATNQLKVNVRNVGNREASDKMLRFFVGDRQVASTTISLKGEEAKTFTLSFRPEAGGNFDARVEVEDYPLIFDDRYYFSIRVAPRVRVLFLHKDNRNTSVAKVFKSEAELFDFEMVNVNSFDYNLLQNADLIIADGISNFDEALRTELSAYVRRGGSIALFPAGKPQASVYQKILGVNFNTIEIATTGPQSLATPDANSSFYEGVFERITSDMSMPKTRPSLQIPNALRPILRFRSGATFLGVQQMGGSYVFVAASPLATEYGDFSRHALFVPTLFRMAIMSKRIDEPLAFSFAESYARIAIDSLKRDEVFTLRAADGNQELIPAQRIDANHLLLEMPKESLPAGNYHLIRQRDGKEAAKIAFNYDQAESDLDCYSEAELRAFFQNYTNIQFFSGDNSLNLAKAFEEKNKAFPLWRYFVIAALGFLLIATLLIRSK